MKTSGKAFIFKRQSSLREGCSFSEACAALREELLQKSEGNDVFKAHLEILGDPMISDGVAEAVSAGMSEDDALSSVCDGICAMFSEIDDEYLRARADDVRDVCNGISRLMAGEVVCKPVIPDGAILVAEELLPSDTSVIDFSKIRGIICQRGSSTSHVCIISRSKAVPVCVGRDISGISDGDELEVDDPLVGESPAEKIRQLGKELYCNAAGVDDIRAAIAAGADGIGLFRTEFLFLDRNTMPDLQEQTDIYEKAILACEGKPLTIRTLDVGGDKQLPWLKMPVEDNPFLGLRGIRLCLKYPEILRTQMQAVVEASLRVRNVFPQYFEDGATPVRLMFPMVDTLEEIRAAKSIVEVPDGLIKFGIMVETPAAVFSFDSLVGECSFISFGTNDLTQYIMAADRGNSEVSYLYQPLSGAVLKAMEMVVSVAKSHGVHTGICGEIASDILASGTLSSLGIDSFSVNKL